MSKQVVYCQANLQSLTNVDTVNQTFDVEAVFKLRWEASPQDINNWNLMNSSTDSKELEEADSSETPIARTFSNQDAPTEFIPSFIPKISFPNAAECDLVYKDGTSEFFTIALDKANKTQMVVYDFQIRCTFRETLELGHFPFDCQDLPIIMKLGNKGGTAKYALMPDVTKKAFGKVDLTNCLLTQWTIHPTLVEFGYTDPTLSKAGDKKYPLFVLRMKIQRRYEFYIQRFVLILAALSLSSLSAYAVDVSDVADRLGIDFTLLLTIVAFQQTVSDSLPVLPFVTVMDAYVLVSLFFVFAVTLQHALMPADNEELDDLMFWIFLGVWVALMIGFAIYCPIISYKERKKLSMNSEELKTHLKEEGTVLAHKFTSDEKAVKEIEKGKWCSMLSTID